MNKVSIFNIVNTEDRYLRDNPKNLDNEYKFRFSTYVFDTLSQADEQHRKEIINNESHKAVTNLLTGYVKTYKLTGIQFNKPKNPEFNL